ncbi:MAG: peptidoglycan-binding protein [Anaerococcus sp.]
MNKKLKVTGLVVALAVTFAACSNDNSDTMNSESTENVEVTESTNEDLLPVSEEGSADEVEMSDVVLHRAYAAPHGEDSVARVVVLTSGDKIIDATLDEMQYFDEDSNFKALPNSDGQFGEGAVEGKILGSKTENNDEYSKLMTENADSKVSISDNYKAICDFVKGKTITEVEDAISNKNEDGTVDAVTEATLVDTANYLQAIVDTAKDDSMLSNVKAENIEDVTLYQAYGAPHGDQAFGDVVVAVEDGVVVGASIDEFQYFGENGLPNSDKTLGNNFADSENQLSSKLQSNEAYSELMAENANSEVSLADNYKAIEEFTIGKTADEIQSVIDENEEGKPVDAISEATLVDTVGYLQLIVDAIK